jgi:hypothetical protein
MLSALIWLKVNTTFRFCREAGQLANDTAIYKKRKTDSTKVCHVKSHRLVVTLLVRCCHELASDARWEHAAVLGTR